MTGGFLFKITAKRVQYEFNVSRKIMRITGDSATGKSELIRVLGDAGNPKTGISTNCKYKCEVITDVFFKYIKEDIIIISNTIKNHSSTEFYDAMRNLLKRYDDTLFFADEDFKDIGTDEFALFCKFTDSFFVLICRNSLGKLPYSYKEIYTIKTSGKFHSLIPKYNANDFSFLDENRNFIVEDSNAGYEFYKYFYNNVVPAEGKSKIKSMLKKSNTMVIADGAAFGCEIEGILGTISRNNLDIRLFLPESFEYLVLDSELFSNYGFSNGTANTVNVITGLYFSWERYFTAFLTELTKDFENCYSKGKLNQCYYLPCCCKGKRKCNLVFTAKKKEAVLKKYLEPDKNKKE